MPNLIVNQHRLKLVNLPVFYLMTIDTFQSHIY